jgi:hypothetical protein
LTDQLGQLFVRSASLRILREHQVLAFREEALCEVQIAAADRKYGGIWKVVANLGSKEAAGREAYP